MKKLNAVRQAPQGHWVGDGFPVKTLVDYSTLAQTISPFLLLDYAGPAKFSPGAQPLGVGEHPHRGFETVTIVYSGELAHRDSTGKSGVIGQGDVQWMTAGSGILHEEFHSSAFTRNGGTLEMVQLWVNLPAEVKMSEPHYQSIHNQTIPTLTLNDEQSTVRVIAGSYNGQNGPAESFTPVNVWDASLKKGLTEVLPVPAGHNAILTVLHGSVTINGDQTVEATQTALFTCEGKGIMIEAKEDAVLLILSGTPINEPMFGHGPFVMNTREEVQQAIADYRDGRFGQMPEKAASEPVHNSELAA